ncbi:MAG: hypothetical protein KGL39_59335 [Patescibacteria group bacterium]|nr:hypothetical protein [Patescibacteria group bacterium]
MSDWIEWHGGECPVGPDVRVQVELQNGNRFENVASEWSIVWGSGWIVRYRIVSQDSEFDRLRAERDALDIQVCELISQVENTIYALGGDTEAIRQAKGCVEYAREVRRRYGNGS